MAKTESVLDKIKALDEQRAQLLSDGKNEALQRAQDAIAELSALGFDYRLTQGTGTSASRTTRTATGARRAGIRGDVLNAVKAAGANGVSRAALLVTFQAKGDKSAEQSISNALSALKKDGTVDVKDGSYFVA